MNLEADTALVLQLRVFFFSLVVLFFIAAHSNDCELLPSINELAVNTRLAVQQ